jgi:hypothetical protein
MQPSKEREAADGDPLEDVDDLLDDDLAGGDSSSVAPESDVGGASPTTASDDGGRVGVDGDWFSLKAFVAAVLAVGVGVFLGGLLPLIGGTVGPAAGVLLGAFLAGVVFSTRRYVETGVAGAAAGAGTAVLNLLSVGFLPVGLDYVGEWGVPLLAVGGGLGLGLALVGHYFGRDLRAGITSELPG